MGGVVERVFRSEEGQCETSISTGALSNPVTIHPLSMTHPEDLFEKVPVVESTTEEDGKRKEKKDESYPSI